MPRFLKIEERKESNFGDQRIEQADAYRQVKDYESAAALIEGVMRDVLSRSPIYPPALTIRLASLYRTLRRYSDEQDLLERCLETQPDDESQWRFAARLSKVRVLVNRRTRTLRDRERHGEVVLPLGRFLPLNAAKADMS